MKKFLLFIYVFLFFVSVLPAKASDAEIFVDSEVKAREYANPWSPVYAPEKARLLYLQYYAGLFLRNADGEKSCVHSAEEWAKSELSISPPQEYALRRIIQLCRTKTEKLKEIAQGYECGCKDVPQNKDIAISVYYYLHFGRKDGVALYHLKRLGANVVTEPPTKEESEKISNELKKLETELKKRNLNSPFE